MYWIRDIQNAIQFIEDRLPDDLSIDEIAKRANSSGANFQRIFHIVTGMTVGDYVRGRKLSLAGRDLSESKARVVDMALKYGYETAESFSKAFARFHGVTPSKARTSGDKLKAFSPISIEVFIKGGFGMSRKVIPNIPVIDNYGSEVDYVISLLEAAFNVAGEETDKAELAAYSGMGNRFCWMDGKWARGNESIGSINETPFEEELRMLKAIGWKAKYITIHRDKDGSPLNTDDAQIKRDIVDAIDMGYPVLTRYASPGRYNIIIGYEDDGDRIVSKDAIETTGVHTDSETNIRGKWQQTIAGYILLKEKVELAPERERAFDLFDMIVSRARRTDEINGIKVGFAAWESFLRMLEYDDFTQLAAKEVGERMSIYCDGLCGIWGRNAALPYYRSLAERFPEWREELEKAVAALDACANYAGFLWKMGFTMADFETEKFGDPAARKKLADEGRKAMQKDMEAVEQFEMILKKESRPSE